MKKLTLIVSMLSMTAFADVDFFYDTTQLSWTGGPVDYFASWSASAPWTPVSLSGCEIWLDASDSASVTLDGSNVSAINDKSGNANHFTQSVSGNRPFYVSSAIGGLNVMSFTNDTLRQLYSTKTNAYRTVAMVIQIINQVELDGLWGYYNGGFGIRLANSIQFDGTVDYAGDVNDFTYTPGVFRLNGAVTGTYVKQTSYVLLGYNSAPSQAGNFQSSIGQYFYAPLQRQFIGYIGEFVAFNRVLDASEISLLEAYLAAKWGISF